MTRTAARACSMPAGACSAAHRWAVYSAGVCPVEGEARRPRSAHQAVKVARWRA
ncbi:hypothetical protein [Nonomuraea sp. JJY05]|uniref:hypothetical protein n=1 Tax=Nonomuraea sp. JJY05 TaxID=3350255 RepID=UPI00373F4C9C